MPGLVRNVIEDCLGQSTGTIARVDLDGLFEGRSHELILVFDKILAGVSDWPKVLVGVTPSCIVFTRRVGFLIIMPLKKRTGPEILFQGRSC